MSNYLNTLQEAVDILSNGTHSWMERLFSKGPTEELKNLSSMNVWNGWMTWQADYRPADTGYLTGRLWLLYILTGEDDFKNWAIQLIKGMSSDLIRYPQLSHVSGVDTYYGPAWGYDITGEEAFKTLSLKSAQNQIDSIFSEKTNVFYLSHGRNVVNIDCTAFLLDQPWAGRYDNKFMDYFKKHNDEILNLRMVRKEGNYFQVAYFDSNEEFDYLTTHQGWRVDSTWARGQSWGMHNFCAAYESTGNENYLNAAIKMCDWWVSHNPSDYIPFYDFEDPEAFKRPKDSCAAAMAATALMRISRYVPEKSNSYQPIIEGILTELTENYLSIGGQLLHGSWGNTVGRWSRELRFPQEDIVAYGNYYFAESIFRQLVPDWSLFELNPKNTKMNPQIAQDMISNHMDHHK